MAPPGALLGAVYAATDNDTYLIWDEAQTELAGEADLQLRRGEMTRLIQAGRGDEAMSYHASPQASLIRMAREVSAPRRR